MSRTVVSQLGIINNSTLANKFKYDQTTTTGLTFGYDGGTIALNGNPLTVASGTVALTDNSTNIVQLATDGTISAAVSGTESESPLYKVVTSAGVITSITDLRATFNQ